MKARKRIQTALIPLVRVSLPESGIHLLVKSQINRRVAWLVVDTGASRTVLDIHRVHKYLKEEPSVHESLSTGLGTSEMKSYSARLKKMYLGEVIASDYEVILLDLGHINKTLKAAGMREIDGVLGGDLLAQFGAEINYAKGQLKLHQPR